jgi:uncharacterized protein
MTIQLFPATGRTTINWASGTSTQIFIYPSEASFAERNFLFRISTATVVADESVFTFFEGITRHLMILKGTLELIHEGRYTKLLAPYDQDTFSGEWNTRSKGRVTDFNLMLKEGATGSLKHQRIEMNSRANLTATTDFYFVYVASGTATYEGQRASTGDLLQIPKGMSLAIEASDVCDLIVIEVAVQGD